MGWWLVCDTLLVLFGICMFRYRLMAERGMRVLALAYRRLSVDTSTAVRMPRDEVETQLTFAGFIAFECRTRVRSSGVL